MSASSVLPTLAAQGPPEGIRAPSLVLASTSTFRRELLARLQLPFCTARPGVDESALPGEAPEATAMRLSEAKARAVAAFYPDALLIGSDQVAVANGKRYGKPGEHSAAVQQLRELSEQTAIFHTGLCLYDNRNGEARVRCVDTQVRFRKLNDDRIENYLQREQACSCAGSAKSEGLGVALIAAMRSDDPTALVGLPLITLVTLLQAAGVDVV